MGRNLTFIQNKLVRALILIGLGFVGDQKILTRFYNGGLWENI